MHKLQLWDHITEQPIVFTLDSGAAITCISKEFAQRKQLKVQPLHQAADMPRVVGQASVAASLTVQGVTKMELQVPGTATSLRLWAAVIPGLFVDAILGRNSLEEIALLYGDVAMWTVHGKDICKVEQPTGWQSAEVMQGGADVMLLESLLVPKNALGHRWECHGIGTFWMPEQDLKMSASGECIATVQGMFCPDVRNAQNVVLAASTVVNATVDWSSEGMVDGRRRLVFPVRLTAILDHSSRSVDSENICVVSKGTVLGSFVLGRPSVAVVTSSQDEQTRLLDETLLRVLGSPLLIAGGVDKKRAREVLSGFRFVEELEQAAQAKTSPFTIELVPGAKPVARRNFPMTFEEERFVEDQIRKWLKSGTIAPAESSPWASPIVVAYHARTGKPRLCLDYRSLNAATVADTYLSPQLSDVTRVVQGKKVFSGLDLAQGYGQFPVDPNSRAYTTFRGTRGSSYQFVGAPFGLRNLPSAFQRLMDTILGDLKWESAACYIDDVIVFSNSVQEHHVHLEQLAARFASFGIVVRASKCTFYVSKVQYLGYWLDGQTISVLPERVEAILKCEVPEDRAGLRAFLGLTGQFRHLINNYAEIAAPLEVMKHQSSKVSFDIADGSSAAAAFARLKEALVQMPDLALPDFSQPFHAYADASDVAMSFVLCQNQGGKEHVISFYSKAFKGSQMAWSTPSQGSILAALLLYGQSVAILGVRRTAHYLCGFPVVKGINQADIAERQVVEMRLRSTRVESVDSAGARLEKQE